MWHLAGERPVALGPQRVLIRGRNPGSAAAQVQSKLSTRRSTTRPPDPSFGFGRENLRKALTP
jgi:hypothetical protein